MNAHPNTATTEIQAPAVARAELRYARDAIRRSVEDVTNRHGDAAGPGVGYFIGQMETCIDILGRYVPLISGSPEEPVILKPILEKAVGFQNTRLVGFKVVSAPPYVCAHILDAQPGETAGNDVLVALAENGHAFTIEPPAIQPLSAMEYRNADDRGTPS